MKDRMGREIDYMRFSITDRCNLRCKYCMPDGIDCMPRWDVLSLEEFEAIAIAAASLGIKKIKVTGGEPLARKSCPQLVKMLKISQALKSHPDYQWSPVGPVSGSAVRCRTGYY